MEYSYRAYTIDRTIVEGTIEAISESMAEEALRRAGYQRVLSLKEIRPGTSLEKLIPTLFGVKNRDVIEFSHQLATLTESGINILTALQLLTEQSGKVALNEVINELIDELREGNSFSQALSKHPQVFSYTYCQVIKASEQAGNLEVGLRQVANYMEKQAAMTSRIARALAYPIIVALVAIGVFVLMITVALPPLVGLFTALGADLPWATELVIVLSTFFIDSKLYLLGGLLALIIFVFVYTRLPAGKLAMDRIILKIPAIGSISIQRNMCRFCQLTAMMIRSGLQLPEILGVVILTVRNRIIYQALDDVRDKLLQGQGLSKPMAANSLFPKLLVEMVVVGENTGNLESALATVADYYEQRVDRRINTLISMIEPVMTIIIGLVIAFIALSMIMPLYSILQSL